MKKKQSVLKTLIVGGGKGCEALLPILCSDKLINIIGVCDVDKGAPGLLLARKMGITTTKNFKLFLKKNKVDLIIDVTGSLEIRNQLDAIKKPGVEMLGGLGAKIIWDLVNEKQVREDEMEQSLAEQEALYNIGIMLISAKNIDMVFRRIVQSAIKLSKSQGGSFALYDEKTKKFQVAVSIGFSEKFSKNLEWTLRKGGLTDYILSSNKPTVITDLSKEVHFKTSSLMKEKVKSLIGVPLALNGKIIGILNVSDTKPNKYSKRQASLMALLATQATFAIEKNRLLERAEQLAITDELTQLFNHRYFVHALEREINRSKRLQSSICFLIMDIDHFKHYNDTQGHQNGNVVLSTVAKLMQENIRQVDTVARYGGEEFAAILPGVGCKGGLLIADRIRKAIADLPFPYGDSQPGGKLTISTGLACFPEDALEGPELVERADSALYKAKRAGRNRVVVYLPKAKS